MAEGSRADSVRGAWYCAHLGHSREYLVILTSFPRSPHWLRGATLLIGYVSRCAGALDAIETIRHPALGHRPAFCEQQASVCLRQVEDVADVKRAEIDAIQSLRQFPRQSYAHPFVGGAMGMPRTGFDGI